MRGLSEQNTLTYLLSALLAPFNVDLISYRFLVTISIANAVFFSYSPHPGMPIAIDSSFLIFSFELTFYLCADIFPYEDYEILPVRTNKSPWLRQYQFFSCKCYINGKVFTSATP